MAFRIEMEMDKEKIIELYMNRIYFGSGLYGVEAASQAYFGKPASDMSLSEALDRQEATPLKEIQTARMAQAKIMSVFLAREEDPREALQLIDKHFADCPVTPVLTQVGGYSAPEKRIEIEISASLG